MWPIIWRESADADLAEIIKYIAQFDMDAADRMWRRPQLPTAIGA